MQPELPLSYYVRGLSYPDFSVARMEESFHFKDPAELKHFTDGLRLAGFK